MDCLASEWIPARVVKCCGDVERRGDEVLYLIGPVAVALKKYGEGDHRVSVRAGVAGDVIGNDELLRLARFRGGFLEGGGKTLEIDVVGLFHQFEDVAVGMLGS